MIYCLKRVFCISPVICKNSETIYFNQIVKLKYTNVRMKELKKLIENNHNPRELKRALAVQMVYQRYTYCEIRDAIKVSVGFISNRTYVKALLVV